MSPFAAAQAFASTIRPAVATATTKQGLAKALRDAARPLVRAARPRDEDDVAALDAAVMAALAGGGINPRGELGQFARQRVREIAMLPWQIAMMVGGVEAASGGTVTVSIAQSEDDARQSTTTGAMLLDGTELVFNTVSAYYGVRFQNIVIPPGATIVSATIQFTASANGTGSTTLRTVGFLGDVAAFTTTDNDISDRSVTTELVDWVTGDWTSGDRTSAQLVDVTAIMQEIVDDAGWASGNDTGFRLIKTSSNANRAASWDHASLDPATLAVTWTS